MFEFTETKTVLNKGDIPKTLETGLVTTMVDGARNKEKERDNPKPPKSAAEARGNEKRAVVPGTIMENTILCPKMESFVNCPAPFT